MTAPDRIYLEPECCADPTTGRMWCADPDPVQCDDGATWTDYVRLTPELAALIEATVFYQAAFNAGSGLFTAQLNLTQAALTYARTQEPTP